MITPKSNRVQQSSNLGTKRVRTIKKDLLINNGDLDLYLELFLTDENGKTEKIISKKGDSLLIGFLKGLYGQMAGYNSVSPPSGLYHYSDVPVGSVSAGTDDRIRITIASGYVSAGDGFCIITGATGIELDGSYSFERIASNQIDLIGTTYTPGYISGGTVALFSVMGAHYSLPYYQNFSSPAIIVGTGDSTVYLNDPWLASEVTSSLTTSSTIISPESSDSQSCQITFTRTFSNSNPASITINEIGLSANLRFKANISGSPSDFTMPQLIMRDLISPGVEITQGKTLTVNYRIKTILGSGTDPGGFITNFLKLLYRQFALTTRAANDIANFSRTEGHAASTLKVVGSGGGNHLSYVAYPSEEPGWQHGIVVGTGNTAVSMSDYFLDEAIPHGSDANEMLYYGGIVENFQIGADFAEFQIIRTIENASGNSIEISEYGLTAGGRDGANTSTPDVPRYLHLIARNVLTEPITILNDEILKVVYSIRVIVGEGGSS